MPCKPGVAGLISGFSMKPLLAEPSGAPVPQPSTGYYPWKSHKKFFFSNNKMQLPRRYFFCVSFMFFSVLCLLCLCARLFICALWSPAGKGLTSWLSFVLSNCEFVTFPWVSWVRCGT